jgi:hypothetical protein
MTVRSGNVDGYSAHRRQAATLADVTATCRPIQDVMPVRIESTATVVKTESSSLCSTSAAWARVERLYTLLVTSVGLAILLAMINERQREFGAMLGANLGQLRAFFAEARRSVASALIGFVVGVGWPTCW